MTLEEMKLGRIEGERKVRLRTVKNASEEARRSEAEAGSSNRHINGDLTASKSISLA